MTTPTIAEQKANDSRIGWTLTVIGAIAFVVGSISALLMIKLGASVDLWLVALVGMFLLFGFAFAGLGLHLVAREAAPRAIKSISAALVGIINAVRGK